MSTDTSPKSDFSSTKRHVFNTSKAFTGFWLSCCAQLCVFTAYNIVANVASSIHKDKAMLPMALLYVLYIISSFLAPIFVSLVGNRASILTFVCSFGYLLFAAGNIGGTSVFLFLGAIFCGCGAPMWVAASITTTKLSLYIAERDLLRSIQKGSYLTEIDEENDPKNHPIRQITDATNDHQIDWYISTIIDKNNRLINDNLTQKQKDQLQVLAASQLGAFNTVSWLFMQASSIVGALIGFGLLNLKVGSYTPDVYESETPSVRIMYGVFTAIAGIGVILYFIASRVIPGRVYYLQNKRSKWDLHLDQSPIRETGVNEEGSITLNEDGAEDRSNSVESEESPGQATPSQSPPFEGSMSKIAPLNNTTGRKSASDSNDGAESNSNAVSFNTAAFIDYRHLFPGKSLNDPKDDKGQIHKPSAWMLLRTSVVTSLRMATDKSILLLLFVFLTAYCPLSFTLSAFTAKGGLKDVIGVLYIPLFIGLVALADVVASFTLKFFLKTVTIARIVAISGLGLQLLSIILMYIFPYTDWNGTRDAWKFAAIIGVIQGIGDAANISGLNTLLAVMCRADSRLVTSGFSLLMVGRGLGLCLMFVINSESTKDSFRTTFWPIIVTMISVSILLHFISWFTGWSVNVEYVLPPKKVDEQKEQDNQPTKQSNNANDHVAIELEPVGEDQPLPPPQQQSNSNAVTA